MATNPKLPEQARLGPQAVPGTIARREQQALKRYVAVALIIIAVLIAALVFWFVRWREKARRRIRLLRPRHHRCEACRTRDRHLRKVILMPSARKRRFSLATTG